MDRLDDKTVSAVELRAEVEALRLRVAELEASREAAQRAETLRQRQASALARLGTWEWEASTDRVTWSGDMFRIYGIRPEEFTGKGSDYIRATRADYRELQQRNLEVAWKNGVTEEAFRAGAGPIGDFKELCIVRSDGTECYTLGDAVCIVDADGKPLRMLGITVDITESKKAEQALRQSEERLHLACQAAGFGTYSYDFTTGAGHWSPELRAHWGIGPDDSVKLDADGLVTFLHPEDRAGFLAAMTSANDPSGDGIFELDCRVIWPDRSVHWLRVRGRTEFTGEGENRRPWRANGATVDITERKLAVQALREALILHSSIVNSTPDLIWSVDPATFGLLTFNRSLEAYFLGIGISLQIGLAPEHLFPTQDWAERWREFYRRALREGAYSTEYETSAENRVLHLSFNVLERDGVVFGISVFGRDITERKRSERALQESEEKYRILVEESPDPISSYTPELIMNFVNRAFADAYGRPVEDIVGKRFGELLPREEAAPREAALREVFCSGKRHEGEFRLSQADGCHAYLLTFVPIKDVAGTVTSVIGISKDITALKRAEEQLSRSEAKLRRAQATAHMGNWTWYPKSNRLEWSEEMYRVFGVDSSKFTGDLADVIARAIHPDDRQKVDESNLAVVREGKPVPLEYRVIWPDQSVHFIWAEAGDATRDESGTIVALSGYAQDITERKRAEAERVKLETQLQQAQKMESVGRLAGGVAHDFNNMLGVILGHAEMAMEKVDPTEEALRSNLEEIRKAAERSANLTRQLLAFARKQTVAPKVLDLNETVAGMLKMLRRLVGEDIDLVWLPGAELCPVKVDPSQVDQILANLCVNARDAIGGVGKLAIETANSTFDDVYCAAHPEVVPGEYVKLTVTDDGCGMDTAIQEKLFEPFFTTKEVGKGTGLGLATVYGIVKQNNGFINVTSEPGKGATFEIWLPRYVAAKKGPAQSESLTGPVARGHETILVVEDEPAILNLTKAILERMGYTVLAAGTPGEAIRLANTYPGEIHLLMTDVVMPEMNGRDLAKNLLTCHPTLKRLFMSGYTADVIAHHGVLDEGVHFIQKPFSKKDLAARVSEALERG